MLVHVGSHLSCNTALRWLAVAALCLGVACKSGGASERGAAGGAQGCIEGDCENGTGVFVYPNGDRYAGEFKNSQRAGKGVFDYANGDRFAGQYAADVRTGTGAYTFANGDVYEGEFQNGERAGQGVYRFKDGAIFRGQFQNDGQAGQGSLVQNNAARDCELSGRSLKCGPESTRTLSEPAP
jgi:hypothetical protein